MHRIGKGIKTAAVDQGLELSAAVRLSPRVSVEAAFATSDVEESQSYPYESLHWDCNGGMDQSMTSGAWKCCNSHPLWAYSELVQEIQF